MDKFVFKKIDAAAPRTVVWPVTVTRALDGGKTVKLQLDVKYQIVDPETLARATSQLALMNRDGSVAVFDQVVAGFPGLPGAEGVAENEVMEALRSDPEAVRGIADGYYAMLRGIVPGN